MVTVFYGNQVFGEYHGWTEMREACPPDGAYIYSHDPDMWYLMYMGATLHTEYNEVPAMCKAWMLIL